MIRLLAGSARRIWMVPAIALAVVVGIGGYTFWYGQGLSYLSDDPAACVNCHIMKDNSASWALSSHRDVTCNSCHLPHDPVGKYLAKAEHGWRHSWSFTFLNVQVLRVTPKSYHDVQENCINCHEPTVGAILQADEGGVMSCTRCHRGAGHVL